MQYLLSVIHPLAALLRFVQQRRILECMFNSPGICFASLNVLIVMKTNENCCYSIILAIELEELEGSKRDEIGNYAKTISRTIATTLPIVVAIKFTTSLFIHAMPRRNLVRVPQ